MIYLLFALGVLLIFRYFIHTTIPWCRGRFDRAATAASSTLREDLLFLSPSQVGFLLLLLFLVPATLVTILSRNPWAGASAGMFCALLSGAMLRLYRNRRRKRIAAQLPGLLDILTGHLQAGHSLPEALHDAIPLLPRGIREEVAWIFQQIHIGIPLSEAIGRWETRIPVEEVILVARPLRSALSTGSDAANLLARCRDILQAKQAMEGRLRSMTAQSRLQAVVLTLLPPAFLLVLSKIDPSVPSRLLGTPPGIAILCVAAALQLAGWLLIRRIMGERP
ncbi:MAG: hypothetical protein Kow00128_19530 [Deltaproteobacteria bacterium]